MGSTVLAKHLRKLQAAFELMAAGQHGCQGAHEAALLWLTRRFKSRSHSHSIHFNPTITSRQQARSSLALQHCSQAGQRPSSFVTMLQPKGFSTCSSRLSYGPSWVYRACGRSEGNRQRWMAERATNGQGRGARARGNMTP